jgi:hypothetical protein
MPDALPAVTVTFSLRKTGLSFAMSSIVASWRMCSSASNSTVPFLDFSSTGTIWPLKRPALLAADARRWLSSARPSWSWRVMPYFAATFSAVTPMWITSNGSCSAPVIMSSVLKSPIRAPQRALGTMYGPRLIDSAPPPIATSVSPSSTLCAAETIACRPEPHSRLTFIAGTSCVRPPSIAATRDRYMSFGSVLITWPNTTAPTCPGCTPARATASRTTSAASWVGGTSFRLPPKVPIAVLTALTTTTSRMLALPDPCRFDVDAGLSPRRADGRLTPAAAL